MPYVGECLFPGADRHVDFQCIGPHFYYQLVMDWSRDVFSSLRDVPVFLYSHFQAGHLNRRSLQHLDLALRDHFVMILTRRPDLIVVLMSDHGDVSRACDQKSPVLHFLVPSALLRARPDMAAALYSNQERIVSGWDLFATLKHLAEFQSRDSLDVAGFQALLKQGIGEIIASPVKHFQEVTRIDLQGGFEPKSLFQLLPLQRGCVAAGIKAHLCAARTPPRPLFCTPWSALSRGTQALFAKAAIA